METNRITLYTKSGKILIDFNDFKSYCSNIDALFLIVRAKMGKNPSYNYVKRILRSEIRKVIKQKTGEEDIIITDFSRRYKPISGSLKMMPIKEAEQPGYRLLKLLTNIIYVKCGLLL